MTAGDTMRTWWEPDMRLRLNSCGGSSDHTRRCRCRCCALPSSAVYLRLRLRDEWGCTSHLLNRSGNRPSDGRIAAFVREPAPYIVHARTARFRGLLVILVMAWVAIIRTPAPRTSTNIHRDAQLGHIPIHVHRAGRIRIRPRPRVQPPSRPRTDPRARAVVKM